MNEDIEVKQEVTLKEVYDKSIEPLLKVKGIFDDFFGEDRIDLQGYPSYEKFEDKWNMSNMDYYVSRSDIEGLVNYVNNLWFNDSFILVHFPEVRVTNENNRYIDITHLWAKIYIDHSGKLKGSFKLNRSEYTESQFKSDYLHSHVNGIPCIKSEFLNPCTGTGPINRTITTLNIGYDENIWQLFCLELDKYVRVESLSGVPYRHLEKIGKFSTNEVFSFVGASFYENRSSLPQFWDSTKLSSFLSYLFNSNVLSYNYYNNQYGIAMSFIEYIIAVSNAFIEWYNKNFCEGVLTSTFNQLLLDNVIIEADINNNSIKMDSCNTSNNRYIYSQVGTKVCTFKGQDVTLNIIKDTNTTRTRSSVIINLTFADFLLASILKLLNCNYGRNSNTEEDSSTVRKTKMYL